MKELIMKNGFEKTVSKIKNKENIYYITIIVLMLAVITLTSANLYLSKKNKAYDFQIQQRDILIQVKTAENVYLTHDNYILNSIK
jgi:hypothetical protein